MLEAENWTIALKRYEGHPIPALLLAHQLMAIRQCLKSGRKGIPDAIAGLDLAIDSLYPHTDFHKVSHKLYLERLNGTLKLKQLEVDIRLLAGDGGYVLYEDTFLLQGDPHLQLSFRNTEPDSNA